MVRTKIDQYRNRPLRGTQIAKSLIMLTLRQLRQRFAFNNNIPHRGLNDQVHLQVRFEGLAHEEGMKLLLLLERDALGGEELGQSLLVDILRQTGPLVGSGDP